MGKTEFGAVWLDKKLLSPYDYWQFWRNVDDRDVIKFFKMFTDLNVDEIDKITKSIIVKLLLISLLLIFIEGKFEPSKFPEKASLAANSELFAAFLP